MEDKKKMSKFGKVWIIVCIAALALGLLVAYFGLLAPEMEEYNNHEHDRWCPSECIQEGYDSAFSYAEGPSICAVFGGGAFVLSNIVMLIIWSARRSKETAANAQTNPLPSVSIPTGEGEQMVLQRHYSAFFPVVMIVLGILSALLGLVAFMDGDDELGPVVLIAGLVFLIVGFLLRKAMKIHLVVTTKRVYIKAPFAVRCNLPLNRIAAVGTGLFRYLKITSTAGRAGSIHLFLVPKYLEVYDTVNALLNEVE